MSYKPDLKIRVRFRHGDIYQPRFSMFDYPGHYPSETVTFAPHFTMHKHHLAIQWKLKDPEIRFVVGRDGQVVLEFFDLCTGCPVEDPPIKIHAPVHGKHHRRCTTYCEVDEDHGGQAAVLFHMKIINQKSYGWALDPTIICPIPRAPR